MKSKLKVLPYARLFLKKKILKGQTKIRNLPLKKVNLKWIINMLMKSRQLNIINQIECLMTNKTNKNKNKSILPNFLRRVQLVRDHILKRNRLAKENCHRLERNRRREIKKLLLKKKCYPSLKKICLKVNQ